MMGDAILPREIKIHKQARDLYVILIHGKYLYILYIINRAKMNGLCQITEYIKE